VNRMELTVARALASVRPKPQGGAGHAIYRYEFDTWVDMVNGASTGVAFHRMPAFKAVCYGRARGSA
jgi:hypothetical protein